MKQKKGILFVVAASFIWGSSGTVAQFIFSRYQVDVMWLVSLRMLGSGLMLLLLMGLRSGKKIFLIFKSRTSVGQLLIFSLFGMVAVQLTYFRAVATGNAASATVLQHNAPLIIYLYLAIRYKIMQFSLILPLALSVSGVYLLVTNGSLHTLVISIPALAWVFSRPFPCRSIPCIRALCCRNRAQGWLWAGR